MSIYHVNTYECDRASGGPEEGGWWFECGVFVSCEGLFTHHGDAQAKQERVQKRLDTDENSNGNRDLASVNCIGRFVSKIDLELGKDYPERKPHYE